ncbi:GH3 auxin-responsive promoter family protein [Grimontia kaedaensis]|uniref:GH3 auxin-responsive promoter family protein n=1 Tax=Grimontia kaedaensis TaxID=2872157 RepID=A0ABY4WVY7_9GAMM|nr:GH3 auxin-responsive promoter family protein [Grimontia kaedaensis]USH01357.1 GH3 auxin-responsive promoter family protein [Grimontia kaedaensis]
MKFAYLALVLTPVSIFIAFGKPWLYLPLAGLGIMSILLFEYKNTHRLDWRANLAEQWRNVVYLISIQFVLVQLLTRLFHAIPKWDFWPNSFPVWAQLTLLLITSDFLRYWQHRFAHSHYWQLHARHHRPAKLHAANVVIFHPLDKAIQLCADLLPFVLLAVNAEVLLAYGLLYAQIGFLQHSNVRWNLGWLNYIFATGQLHQWHHRLDKNYGNNLSIWDWIFATAYLADSPPERVGASKPTAIKPNLFIQLYLRWQYRNATKRQKKLLVELNQIRAQSEQLQKYEDHGFEQAFSKGNIHGKPLLALAKTSGTSTKSKYLPITKEYCQLITKSFRQFAILQFITRPWLMLGKSLTIAGDCAEEQQFGFDAGAASAWFNRFSPNFSKKRELFDSQLLSALSFEDKQYVSLLMAMTEPKLMRLASANPSTLVLWLQQLQDKAEDLEQDWNSHGARFKFTHPKIYAWLAPRLSKLDFVGTDIALIWPNLSVIHCWQYGNCQFPAKRLQTIMAQVQIDDIGLLASEGVISQSLEPIHQGGALSLDDIYYEFFDHQRHQVELDKLEKDRTYYLAISSKWGLNRYWLNDIVKVVGFIGECPRIIFQQKGEGCTSLTGEKLHEQQVQAAIAQVLPNQSPWFLMLAEPSTQKYHLLINTEIDIYAFDQALQNINIEYQSKRQSSRLSIPLMQLMNKNIEQHYRNWYLDNGVRPSQYKRIALKLTTSEQYPWQQQSK